MDHGLLSRPVQPLDLTKQLALRSIDRFLASLSGSYSCYFHGNFSTIMYDYIPSTFAIIMYFDVVDVVHFRSVLLQDGIYIHR